MSQPSKSRKPPLPPGWQPFPSRTYPGRVYFHNSEYNTSMWQDRLAEFYDLQAGGDDTSSPVDEGKKILEGLKLLTYIPTKIQRPDETSPKSANPPSPTSDESRNNSHNNSTLESESNLLSCDSPLLNRDSPDTFPCHEPESESSFRSFPAASDPSHLPKKNFLRSTIPLDAYSGYESHICGHVSNNYSVDRSSSDSSFQSSQECRPSIVSKVFTQLTPPEFSPFSDSSPYSRRRDNSVFSNHALNLNESKNSSSDSPDSAFGSLSKKQNRNKFELEGNMRNEYGRRPEAPRDFDYDQRNSFGGSNNSGEWRPMTSTVRPSLRERLERARLPFNINGPPRQPQNSVAPLLRPPENFTYRGQVGSNYRGGPRLPHANATVVRPGENFPPDFRDERGPRQPPDFRNSNHENFLRHDNYYDRGEPGQPNHRAVAMVKPKISHPYFREGRDRAQNFETPTARPPENRQLNHQPSFFDGRGPGQASSFRTSPPEDHRQQRQPNYINLDDQLVPWSTDNYSNWPERPYADRRNSEMHESPVDTRYPERNQNDYRHNNATFQQGPRFFSQDNRNKFNGQWNDNSNNRRFVNNRPRGLATRYMDRSRLDNSSRRPPLLPYPTDNFPRRERSISPHQRTCERSPPHRRSVQDRLSKARKDTLQKELPIVKKEPKLDISPSEFLEQCARERPDVVQIPKRSPSSECSDDSISSRKRKAIHINSDFESSGSTRNTSFENLTPSPKRKPSFCNESNSSTSTNWAETSFPTPSGSHGSTTQIRTPPLNSGEMSPSLRLSRGETFIKQSTPASSADTSFEKDGSPLSVLSKKHADSPPILKLPGAISILKSKEGAQEKRVKFSENHEERLFDTESGELMPKLSNASTAESDDVTTAEAYDLKSTESSDLPSDSDEPMESDPEDLPLNPYVMSAEEQQLEAFNLCDEPKKSFEPHGTSNLPKTKVGSAKSCNLAQQRLQKFKMPVGEKKSPTAPKHPDAALMYVPSETVNLSCDSGYSANEEEPMEWEDIPMTEIKSQVDQTRLFLSMKPSSNGASWLPPQNPTTVPQANFFIVLDTNILLVGIPFVIQLRDTNFKDLGYPTLVIPWQVIQEIDAMKDRKCVTQRKAIEAKNFLYDCFSNNHPRMRGQTRQEWEATPVDLQVADDSILFCAEKLKEDGNLVIFVTNDKNLISKAKIQKVECFSKEEMLERIKANQGSGAPAKKMSSEETANEKCLNGLVDNLLCSLKSELLTYFSAILTKGMINTYGEETWSKRCCIKPPWTLMSNCLAVLEKHTIVILSSVPPSFGKAVKEVLSFFLDQEKGKKIDVPRVVMALKAIIIVVEQLMSEEAYKEDTIPVFNSLEGIRKRLTTSCRSPTKTETSSAGPSQSPAVPVLAPAAAPERNNSLVPYLDLVYRYYRDTCASYCKQFNISHNLIHANSDLIDKEPVLFAQELTDSNLFVKCFTKRFESLIEASETGNLSSPEDKKIRDLVSSLKELFRNGGGVDTEIPNSDTFVFFTNPNFEPMRKRGLEQFQELHILFRKCSLELRKRDLE